MRCFSYKRILRFYALCGVILVLLGSGIVHSEVVINEFVASNNQGLQDEDGDACDWIELYNSGASAVSILGWALTDGSNDWDKWTFPNVSIGAGEYLVVFASGKDRTPTNGDNLHTNFSLSASGEYLAMYDASGEPQQSSVFDPQYPEQRTDYSYGRYGTGSEFRYLNPPTPGGPNESSFAYEGFAANVEFSTGRGFYDAPFALTLSTGTPGATIRYTTDGSEPTESAGELYTSAISVANTATIRAAAFGTGYLPSTVVTHTYIFLEDVINQPEYPPEFPTVWHEGFPVNYQMHPDVVDEYRAVLDDALLSIPTMSIVMDMDDLFSQETGIYPNSEERGVAWERPASVELMYPDGREGFDVNCGIRIYGDGSAIPHVNLKHTFRLLFKSMYGPAKLHYPLFEGSPVTEFDTIILRGTSNFSWVHRMDDLEWQRENALYIRDVWARDAQLDMGHLASRSTYVHLYLNGLYWGLYNPSERPSAPFLADHLGGDKEDWDVLNSGEVVDGNRDAWNTMMAMANAGLETEEAYQAIQEYLDVENLIDYMILQHYLQNEDWTGSNWYAGRRREPGAQYMFFIWDAEYSIYDIGANTTTWDHNDTALRLYNRLRTNPEFRMLFADRVHRHLFNGGVLTAEAATETWMERANQINPAIVGESARWGDSWMGMHDNVPYTRDGDWIPALNWVLDEFLPYRPAILVDQYRAIDLYPDVEAPVFHVNGVYQHGGYVTPGDSLTMVNANASGTIYYTLDGSDPRVRGTPPAIAGSAIQYTGPITLTDTTHVKARILDGTVWSALNRATFYTRALADALRVTELMYHPAGGGAEFIELHNVGSEPEDLSGVYFSEGIQFTFGAGTVLHPGEYVVLVSSDDEVSFLSQYPGVAIGGRYEFKLDNGGERIDVRDANGNVLISFTYDDDAPWPTEPDGLGCSLVRVDLEGDPNDPASWSASRQVGGSPGEPESDVTASFTAMPTSGSRPLTVEFTDESEGPVASWLWDFGDGTASTEQNPSHTYYLAGDHTVTLSVSSPNGFDTETGVVQTGQDVLVEGNRYKTVVDDIKVTYNRGGCLAWHNELDGTLRIEVLEDGGTLNLTAGEDAATYWDGRCDVYIYAPDASIKKINLKGRPETQLYVCGQVGYVKNFALKCGYVGDTLTYGPEVGLGSGSPDPPKKIVIKSGWSTAAVLGIGYPELRADPAEAQDAVGSGELKPKPFEVLFDEYVEEVEEPATAEKSAATTKGGYNFEHGAIKVLYSKPGCEADYDPDDDILMIEISENDGDLTVKCGEYAYDYWGDYCDVYIDAPGVAINRMIVKGTAETQLYVCGEVGSVRNLKVKYGCIGDTGHYGPDFGLVNTSLALPSKIKVLRGWTTAPVLGVSY